MRILKIKMVFLFLLSGTCFASLTYSQNNLFTLNIKSQKVKEVLDKIESASDFFIFYNDKSVDLNRKVNIHAKDAEIQTVLDQLFEGTDNYYSIEDRQITILKKAPVTRPQQEKGQIIKGQIFSDEDKEPLIGAVVQIKGTQIATVTDIDGFYELKDVPANATLVISYLGMESQELPAKEQMRITLKTSNQYIDEVVVVAFGEQKRSSFTGSAGVLKTEDLESRQVTNVVQALAGQVAGVQLNVSSGAPDAEPDIRIRGISSINAGQDPLIVVDGMPFDGGFNNINPADVESMTILKDAASSALYGARGANGVILITTKRATGKDAVISVDAKWGVNSRATKTYDYIKEPGLYYEQHYQALYNYYRRQNGLTAYEAHKTANENMGHSADYGGLGYLVYSVPSGEYLIGENGKLNPNATMGNKVSHMGQEYTLMADDWMEEAFSHSLRQEYNLRINGGGEKSEFYTSFGYLNNEGIVSGSDYERYTGRLRASYDAKTWLKVGGNVNYSHYETNGVSADNATTLFSHVTSMAPIYPLYVRDGNGNIMTDENGKIYDYGNGNNAGMVRNTLPNSNPLQTDVLDTNNSVGNSFSGQAFAEIKFLKDFKFSFNIGVNNNEYRSTTTTNPFYGYSSYQNGVVYKYHYRNFSYTMQQLLNYSRTFGNHTVSLLLGHENYNYTGTTLGASKSNMYSYFENQELAGAVNDLQGASSSKSDYNTEGYFMRAQYDYKDTYFFSASYRRDATSRFHPDHRWGNFWSLGGAWILSKENWFTVPFVNMLKYKISYGSQGNDKIGNYLYTDQYYAADADGDISIIFHQKGNRKITWETNGNLNTGIEFELFKGRLAGEIEYFYRKTTDMLSWVSSPLSGGYSGYYDNIGDMVNKGVELDLKAQIFRTRDLQWSVNLNMTHYKNKITYLDSSNTGAELEGYEGFIAGSQFRGVGLPIYSWRLRKFAGVNENGQSQWFYTDENGDMQKTSVYSNGDYYLCGSALPDLYGGFGTSLSYKGFDLNVNFSYSIGGKAFDSGYQSLMNVPTTHSLGLNIHRDMMNAWSEENRESSIPRWQFEDTYTNAISDRWLTNASWLNLQSITFGYNFPAKVTQNLMLSKLRIYMSCDNVYYWSKRQGFDPRYNFSGEPYANGYSPTRTISGGINLEF